MTELGEETLEDGVGGRERGGRCGDGGRVEGDIVGIELGGAGLVSEDCLAGGLVGCYFYGGVLVVAPVDGDGLV